MLTRIDPTRTGVIRHAWEKDIRRRFSEIASAISVLVVDEDVFGLEEGQPFQVNNARQEWRFSTNDKKLEQFQKWLKPLVDAKILAVDSKGNPWSAKFIESSYKKGMVRAFVDARGKDIKKKTDFFGATKESFLKSAFAQPERLSKVRLLATRSFEDLKGVSGMMATQLNKILANGMIAGSNPKQIAREIAKNVQGISKNRALTIARTEIIHAHAEGQLDTFADLGVDELGVLAEWSTAGDDRVCPSCQAMEGTKLSVDDARGLIPLHPNCRCSWIPAEMEKKQKRRSRATAGRKQDKLEAPIAKGVSAADLMAKLLAEGKTDDEIFVAFRDLYAEQGKTDEKWVKERVKIYKKIAQKKGVTPPPPVIVPPPLPPPPVVVKPPVVPPPLPPVVPPPPVVVPPKPVGKESAQEMMKRLLTEGKSDAEIIDAFKELYKDKGKDEKWILSRVKTYKAIAVKGGAPKPTTTATVVAAPAPAPAVKIAKPTLDERVGAYERHLKALDDGKMIPGAVNYSFADSSTAERQAYFDKAKTTNIRLGRELIAKDPALQKLWDEQAILGPRPDATKPRTSAVEDLAYADAVAKWEEAQKRFLLALREKMQTAGLVGIPVDQVEARRDAFVSSMLAKGRTVKGKKRIRDAAAGKPMDVVTRDELKYTAKKLFDTWGPLAEAGLSRVEAIYRQPGRAYNSDSQYKHPHLTFDRMSVLFHEMGHSIENHMIDPGKAAGGAPPISASYWYARIQEKDPSPAKKMIGYGASEVAKADRWGDQYMGKVYTMGSTEVVPMLSQDLESKLPWVPTQWKYQMEKDSEALIEYIGYHQAAIAGEHERRGKEGP